MLKYDIIVKEVKEKDFEKEFLDLEEIEEF